MGKKKGGGGKDALARREAHRLAAPFAAVRMDVVVSDLGCVLVCVVPPHTHHQEEKKPRVRLSSSFSGRWEILRGGGAHLPPKGYATRSFLCTGAGPTGAFTSTTGTRGGWPGLWR